MQAVRALLLPLFAASLVLGASGASAQWVGLLKNSPAELFDDEDLHIFLDTARKALDGAPDGQALSWENPKTRHRGDITVVRSFEWKANPCKELRVRNEAQGRKGDNRQSVCKIDGKWRVVTASQLQK